MPFPIKWEFYHRVCLLFVNLGCTLRLTLFKLWSFFFLNQSLFLTPVTAYRIYLPAHGSVLCVLMEQYTIIHIAVGATVSSKDPGIYI